MKNNNTMQVAWVSLLFFKEHFGTRYYHRPP
jgi:hypothetical protein